MTPKEKAEELVNKYYEDDLMRDDLSYIQAKQCALIAVDEVLSILKSIRHNGGSATDDVSLRLQIEPYYRLVEQVKQEIENL